MMSNLERALEALWGLPFLTSVMRASVHTACNMCLLRLQSRVYWYVTGGMLQVCDERPQAHLGGIVEPVFPQRCRCMLQACSLLTATS